MPKVVHIPAKSSLLDKIARQTCKELAKKRTPAYRTIEVTEGLGTFLNILAEMKAEQLNHQEKLKEIEDA